MHFSITLALLSAVAFSSATPTHPSYTRLLSRRNATVDSNGNGCLNPNIDAKAAAEAHQRDETAIPDRSAFPIKTVDGRCLSILPECGDFRHNLIPLQVESCNSTNDKQKFEIITKGKHITQEGGMLLVSSLTLGCLNFDPRRPAGKQVNIFSCGGRADGDGKETDSQIFSFTDGQKLLPLTLKNNPETCLVVENGNKLGSAGCSGAAQSFTLE
ncbi:MAG: hypothetical protein L6R42_006349 [Xanthoria sp. 1 TBL-2021]|nr:MAG: hypothetical protein L6R42_006349 [Xanthoria sp. 1 TBL-2021]